MKHVRDLRLTYDVIEISYNESRQNDEEVLFSFTDVRDAIYTCREFIKSNNYNNTDYEVRVEWE